MKENLNKIKKDNPKLAKIIENLILKQSIIYVDSKENQINITNKIIKKLLTINK